MLLKGKFNKRLFKKNNECNTNDIIKKVNLKLNHIVSNNLSFSEIFSEKPTTRPQHYYGHFTVRDITYLLFFDLSGHKIQSQWLGLSNPTMCFIGNDTFELSSSVYPGIGDIIKNLSQHVNADKYFILCPTYISTKQSSNCEFIDCQPAITGKILEGTSNGINCMNEMAGEIGIIPNNKNVQLIEKHPTYRNVKINKKKCTIHNYSINIYNCDPYDGNFIISPNFKRREIHTSKIQICIYGLLDDFLTVLSNVRARTESDDFKDIRAIRLIPIKCIKDLYPSHF